MELLKKILKEAVSHKALRLQVQSRSQPNIIAAKGPMLLTQIPTVSEQDCDTLLKALFPEYLKSPSLEKPLKSSMSIVGVGSIDLLAEKAGELTTIKFYFPEAKSMFDEAWSALNVLPKEISETNKDTPNFSPAIKSIPVSFTQKEATQNNLAPPPPPPVVDSPASVVSIKKADENPSEEVKKEEAPLVAKVNQESNSPPASIPMNMFAMPSPTSPGIASLKSLNIAAAPPNLGLAAVPNIAASPVVAPAAQFSMPTSMTASQITPVPPLEVVKAEVPKIQTVTSSASSVEAVQIEIPFGEDPRKSAPIGKGAPIDSILKEMVAKKASDLHMTIGQPFCMRIDGEIERVGSDILTADKMKELLLPIMPPASRLEFAKDSDTDFAYEVPGVARFRVNIFRDRNGVGSVMRQIPSKVLTADQLNLSEAIRRFCHLTKGLVLVTGPTGSGKSTTLAAMVDLINKIRPDHILTIEDPIEFVHEQQKCLVNQREVHRHTNSYARALRAALREDPDIVLIGEMRDLETVEIAIETAETGHLVFGTLHTNTAISTVDRIVDQFPTEQQAQIRVMLAESLKGVVSQTLLKKIGGGRVSAQEILVVNKAISALIREGKTHMIANQMQSNKSEGNVLLNDALLEHVVNKRVTLMDAFVKAVDKDNFASIAQQLGLDISELPVVQKNTNGSPNKNRGYG